MTFSTRVGLLGLVTIPLFFSFIACKPSSNSAVSASFEEVVFSSQDVTENCLQENDGTRQSWFTAIEICRNFLYENFVHPTSPNQFDESSAQLQGLIRMMWEQTLTTPYDAELPIGVANLLANYNESVSSPETLALAISRVDELDESFNVGEETAISGEEDGVLFNGKYLTSGRATTLFSSLDSRINHAMQVNNGELVWAWSAAFICFFAIRCAEHGIDGEWHYDYITAFEETPDLGWEVTDQAIPIRLGDIICKKVEGEGLSSHCVIIVEKISDDIFAYLSGNHGFEDKDWLRKKEMSSTNFQNGVGYMRDDANKPFWKLARYCPQRKCL